MLTKMTTKHWGIDAVLRLYLELANFMQNCFDHSERLVILSTFSSDLIHPQTHEIVMYAHQQHVQIQLLHTMCTFELKLHQCLMLACT